MDFHRESGSSSFTPCYQSKSGDFYSEDIELKQFSKLSLNSHQNKDNRSERSNSSLFVQSIPILIEPRSPDLLSMGSRLRKNSGQLQWKNSVVGNLTFLNKSFAGKSSLFLHEQFNFHEGYTSSIKKELSEKSCPVGTDQTDNFNSSEKGQKTLQEGQILQVHSGKQKLMKKFQKTKNLLRNLSSYLHKYIKYNPRCRNFVYRYFMQKNGNGDQLEIEEFYQGFQEWISQLNLTNFQDYQRVWTEHTKFRSLYRQICYKYYREDLFCDIQGSRLSSKEIIQEYTPQFIQGLLNPKNFTHFQNQ